MNDGCTIVTILTRPERVARDPPVRVITVGWTTMRLTSGSY